MVAPNIPRDLDGKFAISGIDDEHRAIETARIAETVRQNRNFAIGREHDDEKGHERTIPDSVVADKLGAIAAVGEAAIDGPHVGGDIDPGEVAFHPDAAALTHRAEAVRWQGHGLIEGRGEGVDTLIDPEADLTRRLLAAMPW